MFKLALGGRETFVIQDLEHEFKPQALEDSLFEISPGNRNPGRRSSSFLRVVMKYLL